MKPLAVVVFPGFQILDLAAVSAFEVANLLTGRRTYEVTLLSERGGSVLSSAGIAVETGAFGEPAGGGEAPLALGGGRD